MLFLEYVERDRFWVGDVVGYELAALTQDAIDLGAVPIAFVSAVSREQAEHFEQSRFESRDAIGVELDRREVVVGDVCLDLMGGQVRQFASGSAMAAPADEVVVATAELAGALRKDQSLATQSAEDGPLR